MNDNYHEYDLDAFLSHLSKYIGKTVTIYTVSNANYGLGFTGVLLAVTPYMVSVVTQVGPKPTSPPNAPIYNRCNSSKPPKDNIGSITDIPVDKVSAFVHNAV